MRAVFNRLHRFDRNIRQEGGFCGDMAGVDEVGIGPLAGPVVAAAVIFIRKFDAPGLNDSKKVPSKIREKLFWQIAKHSIVGLGVVSELEIDSINIYQAGRLAMRRALLSLSRTPDYILVDGKARIDIPLPQKTIIEGDAKSACIAAASIIAKVYRDAWMTHLDSIYPGYQFKKHKGYSTPLHLEIIRSKGPSVVHRKSFAPVREALEKMPVLA